jgi:hypothetical protein
VIPVLISRKSKNYSSITGSSDPEVICQSADIGTYWTVPQIFFRAEREPLWGRSFGGAFITVQNFSCMTHFLKHGALALRHPVLPCTHIHPSVISIARPDPVRSQSEKNNQIQVKIF